MRETKSQSLPFSKTHYVGIINLGCVRRLDVGKKKGTTNSNCRPITSICIRYYYYVTTADGVVNICRKRL